MAGPGTGTNCKVIVIYDACHSGSFLDDLLPPPGQSRIVIASAGPDERAYFGSQGYVSFSQSLWTSTILGNTVRGSFMNARSSTAYTTNNRQLSMLDDDGDGVWDSHADGQLAQLTYIGDPFITGALVPEIIEKTMDLFMPLGTAYNFYTRVQPGVSLITRVRGVVLPPGADTGSTTTPVTELPAFELTYNPATDRYTGTYSGFTDTGTYVVSFYAEDAEGNTSLPATTTVQVLGDDVLPPAHRFWSPVYQSHHYTIDEWEKNYIIDTWPDYWTYEGIAFYAFASSQPGTLPVHRFWSPFYQSHHYTISEWEKNYIIDTWPDYWIYEGVAFYAYMGP